MSFSPDVQKVLYLLEQETTDYTICKRDWPRWDKAYSVRAVRFFSSAWGVGSTLEEAIKRAIIGLNRRDAGERSRDAYLTKEAIDDLLKELGHDEK